MRWGSRQTPCKQGTAVSVPGDRPCGRPPLGGRDETGRAVARVRSRRKRQERPGPGRVCAPQGFKVTTERGCPTHGGGATAGGRGGTPRDVLGREERADHVTQVPPTPVPGGAPAPDVRVGSAPPVPPRTRGSMCQRHRQEDQAQEACAPGPLTRRKLPLTRFPPPGPAHVSRRGTVPTAAAAQSEDQGQQGTLALGGANGHV